MSITFIKETNTFYLDGKNVTYAFFINQFGYAEHLYYGNTIAHDDLTYLRGRSAVSLMQKLKGTDHAICSFFIYYHPFFKT